MQFEHFLPVAFEELTVCPVGVLTNTPLPPFLTACSAEPSVYIMCPISLQIFLLQHLQSQDHLLCWYLLLSREQARYLQEDGGSEIFLVPVSTTEVVSLTNLWIQIILMCSPEVPGQVVETLSFLL